MTWRRAKSRLATYYDTLKDTAVATKTNSKDETLYKAGWGLFFGGIGWKACQNLSIFIRKPYELVTGLHVMRMRHFEQFTRHWYWIAILGGVVIMIYLYRSNPQILQRIKRDLRQLFSQSRSGGDKYNSEEISTPIYNENELVLNSKREEQLQSLTAISKSLLFNDFVNSLKDWKPEACKHEYEFQDKLFRHLKKSMPEATIELEYPIGSKERGNKGRADVVINDTILIEMKKDSSAGAIQRAKGQILQYSEIWRNKGPVILLLCNYDYDHAKLSFTSTMSDLSLLKRPALTIVAQN
jgi:hypothetical protein